MAENEFRRSVSTDSAPRGSRCEWCGKPAVFQLTAIGGFSHNDSGLFCRECGEKFSRTVAQAAAAASTTSDRAR
ncbi:MAG TPA: hypothetical protein VFV38_27760 [Ktedonobacteraceae bacterium]|nr:hypothetical protein [Ktedonobacteraceae bacterium]